MKTTGHFATREVLRRKAKTEVPQVDLPIAGSVLISGVPKKRKKSSRRSTSNFAPK